MTKRAATVFVIDDDAAVRRSLCELMAAVSLPVESFASGHDFFDAFEPDRPGCLLLDVRLKEESGLDVQEEIRRRKLTLPIIVLTGHGNVPDSVRAMKAGAFDYLQKPPPPALLLEKIRAAIESDRGARAAASELADALRRLSSLTPRERDVVSLLIAGGASKEVASDLTTTMRTVEGAGVGSCRT